MSLGTILLIVFVVALLFGGVPYYGARAGWSPAYYGGGIGIGGLLLLLLVLYLLGGFR